MSHSTTDWLSAIGSIGTTVAAVIALVTLIVTVRSNLASRRQGDAAQIRRNLSLLAQESGVLSRLLNDGSPLVLGSAHIVKEFEARLGPAPTADQLWARLRNEPLMLSVAITGWIRSELSRRIDELLTALRRLGVLLTGELSLLRYPVELYDGIINDAYSPMFFVRMMTQTQLLKDHKGEESVPRILSELTVELQSNSSMYFAARYLDASTNIDKFVQLAVRSLSLLDDDNLLKLSRGHTGSAEEADSRTESMRILLDRVKLWIPNTRYQELSRLIQDIERSISKEGALGALEKLPGRSK